MTYQNFVDFLSGELILTDFNLTDQLQMKLFAKIDQHQKGFITQQDWINTFS
jgi:hypothetical protein